MATSSVMKLLLLLLLLQLLTHGVAAFAAKGGKSAQKKKSPAAATRGFGAKAAPNTAEKAEAAALRNAVAATSSELQRDPRNPQLWLQLGALMVKSGEYAEAERVFRRGAATLPEVETLSAAALTLGGDSAAYWHGESKAGSAAKGSTPKPADFDSYQAPATLLGEYDQVDRSVDWAAHASKSSKRGVVHRSSRPLISSADCAWAIETTEAHAAANGGWTTARHVQAPTTDVPVSQVPALRSWFNHELRTKLFPMLTDLYPYIIPSADNLRVMDAFVVRYDATAQAALPVHQDENILSFTIALNDRSEYEGGGTCFEELRPVSEGPATPFAPTVLNADAGGIVAFPGKLRHGGNTITSGRRYIIPLFVYIDANRSGKEPGYLLNSLELPAPAPGSEAAVLSRYQSAAPSAA